MLRAIIQAERELAGDNTDPPKEVVDEDWLHRWRDAASGTAKEDMQDLWGRLLADEIRRPGSFSLRTIDMLKSFNGSDAKLVEKIAALAFAEEGIIFREDLALQKWGLNFGEILHAAELGVISGTEALGLRNTISIKGKDVFFPCNDKVLIVEGDGKNEKLELPVFRISVIGRELFSLCKVNANTQYLTDTAQHIVGKGFKVKVADLYTENDQRKFKNAIFF